MDAKEMLYEQYLRVYEQRAVLTQAPALTVPIDRFSVDEYPEEKVQEEMAALVAYLCNLPQANEKNMGVVLRIVKNHYMDQPFWKDVILDYLDYRLRLQDESIKKRSLELLVETQQALNDVREEEFRRKELVRAFSDKIAEQKFHVDAYKLMKTYFMMCRRDPKEAYKMLITNPAYFSPIITTDAKGKRILSPKRAKEENARLGRFLAHLKI